MEGGEEAAHGDRGALEEGDGRAQGELQERQEDCGQLQEVHGGEGSVYQSGDRANEAAI